MVYASSYMPGTASYLAIDSNLITSTSYVVPDMVIPYAYVGNIVMDHVDAMVALAIAIAIVSTTCISIAYLISDVIFTFVVVHVPYAAVLERTGVIMASFDGIIGNIVNAVLQNSSRDVNYRYGGNFLLYICGYSHHENERTSYISLTLVSIISSNEHVVCISFPVAFHYDACSGIVLIEHVAHNGYIFDYSVDVVYRILVITLVDGSFS